MFLCNKARHLKRKSRLPRRANRPFGEEENAAGRKRGRSSARQYADKQLPESTVQSIAPALGWLSTPSAGSEDLSVMRPEKTPAGACVRPNSSQTTSKHRDCCDGACDVTEFYKGLGQRGLEKGQQSSSTVGSRSCSPRLMSTQKPADE